MAWGFLLHGLVVSGVAFRVAKHTAASWAGCRRHRFPAGAIATSAAPAGKPAARLVRTAVAWGLAALVGLVGFAGLGPVSRAYAPSVPVLDTQGQPTGLAEKPVPVTGPDVLTILVVGMDSARHVDLPPTPETRFRDIPLDKVRGRTDAIMLLGLDRRSGTIRVLHIPRDSIIGFGSRGEDKIAHYMAYYSFFELKKAVENLLGVPVHRYVVVDFEGFKTLVDALGGVTVTIDHDLQSPEGVWLPKGTHRLDGAQALRLVRHRYGENAGTLARSSLQQTFAVALARELQSDGAVRALAAYMKSPDLLKTNLSPGDIASLMREWRGVDPGGIAEFSLPGEVEEHYWRLDPAGVAETVDEFWPLEVKPPDEPTQALPGGEPTQAPPGEEPPPAQPEQAPPGEEPPPGEGEPPGDEPIAPPAENAAEPGPDTPAAVTQPGPAFLSTTAAMGPGPFVLRGLALLAGVGGDTGWPLAYYPYLREGVGRAAGPVVIYHTHATESFLPELYPAPESRIGRRADEDAFTEDLSHTVVRVGHELTAELRVMGLAARQDATVHDPGGQRGRTGAYGRSRVTAMRAKSGLADPVILLDVHRDAVTQSTTLPDGRRAASILLVVARQNPWWQWNYAFARCLESRLEAVDPGLSRGVRILDGRYNQDLSPASLIVEVGGADSTMEECLVSAKVFADVLADYLNGP